MLSPEKQRIIRKGPFGDLLDIQPFKVPHELIEFVVMHTNHILREFQYKNKSINFSKLMVKRIFNVPSGERPVKLLKKSDEHVLRSIYKEGNRAPIAHVIKLLKDCSDEDEDMINRTWALIALATVVCPGTGNMVNLEYLASLEEMSSVHDLAWDEHLLTRAMEEVAVFQEKKRMQATAENPVEFQIHSCLPMLAVCKHFHVETPPSFSLLHCVCSLHFLVFCWLMSFFILCRSYIWIMLISRPASQTSMSLIIPCRGYVLFVKRISIGWIRLTRTSLLLSSLSTGNTPK